MWFKPTPKDQDDSQPTGVSPSNTSARTYSRKPRRHGSISDKSRATTVMKAMSNSQRLQILSHLINNKEMSVSQLEDTIKTLSQSALSQHLGRLRRADILSARRDSQMVYYSINDDNVESIMSLLNSIYDKDPVLTQRQ